MRGLTPGHQLITRYDRLRSLLTSNNFSFRSALTKCKLSCLTAPTDEPQPITLCLCSSSFLAGCLPVRRWGSAGAGGRREGVPELHEETHTQAGGAVGLGRATTGRQAARPLEGAETGEYRASLNTSAPTRG